MGRTLSQMNGPREPDASRAAKRIRGYLAEHREAADTADGIATWWLADDPVPVGIVEQALKLLMEEKLVERQVLPDGTVIYREARARQQNS